MFIGAAVNFGKLENHGLHLALACVFLRLLHLKIFWRDNIEKFIENVLRKLKVYTSS